MSSTGHTSEGAAYHEVASLLSSKIREVRKATVRDLAHQLGMGVMMLAGYEDGRVCGIDRQIHILLALGLSRIEIGSVIAASGDQPC